MLFVSTASARAAPDERPGALEVELLMEVPEVGSRRGNVSGVGGDRIR